MSVSDKLYTDGVDGPRAALASNRISAMNENTVELEQTEGDIFTDEVSDEALEAAASDTIGKITFTFSYIPSYCNFC